ncbi:MAG: hypothetical protein SFX72_11575 [Isosphaeraceae bacterium]|nr:hypothetical protein [Isosphaeraceae bacterium]
MSLVEAVTGPVSFTCRACGCELIDDVQGSWTDWRTCAHCGRPTLVPPTTSPEFVLVVTGESDPAQARATDRFAWLDQAVKTGRTPDWSEPAPAAAPKADEQPIDVELVEVEVEDAEPADSAFRAKPLPIETPDPAVAAGWNDGLSESARRALERPARVPIDSFARVQPSKYASERRRYGRGFLGLLFCAGIGAGIVKWLDRDETFATFCFGIAAIALLILVRFRRVSPYG